MRLVDCSVRVSGSGSVGICYGDSPEPFACNFDRALACGPLGIEEIVVFIGVTVRPSVDGYGADIARGVEATGAEDAAKLITDISLEGLERSGKQITSADFVLIALGQAGIAGSALHAHKNRLVGSFWRFVVSNVDGEIQIHLVVVHPWAGDGTNAELLKGLPIFDGDRRIHERNFDAVVQCLFLRVG